MTTFAFIGLGEAGTLLATGLRENGAAVIAAYDILIESPQRRRLFLERADTAGVAAAGTPAEAVRGADIVISAVVSDQTFSAAESAAPHLRPGQIYLDINSTSPMVKRDTAAMLEARGGHFVEAAVMDLVPPHGHRVPMLLAGPKAADLETVLSTFGMNARAIGTEIGTASTIKMVRSVFLKGFSAILLECLTAAQRVGGEDHVLDSLQTTFPQLDWRAVSDYYARRLVRHAGRQSSEMKAVAETLEFLGIEPITARATGRRLAWLADFAFAEDGKAPDGYRDLVAAIAARTVAPEPDPGR